MPYHFVDVECINFLMLGLLTILYSEPSYMAIKQVSYGLGSLMSASIFHCRAYELSEIE